MKFAAHLICFCLKVCTVSHLFSLLLAHSHEKVHKDRYPRSFPVWIRGTDKQFNVNPWKFVGGSDVTL